MFKKFIAWILVSSEDPQSVALTVKGAAVAAIPAILFIAGVGHFSGITSDALTQGISDFVTFLQYALYTIGAGVTFYGFVRKLINTFLIPWPAPTAAPSAPAAPAGTTTVGAGSSAKIIG